MQANSGLDMTGIPSHACPACGATLVRILAQFSDYEVAWYTTVGHCAECGCRYTVPTELDRKPELDNQLELLDWELESNG